MFPWLALVGGVIGAAIDNSAGTKYVCQAVGTLAGYAVWAMMGISSVRSGRVKLTTGSIGSVALVTFFTVAVSGAPAIGLDSLDHFSAERFVVGVVMSILIAGTVISRLRSAASRSSGKAGTGEADSGAQASVRDEPKAESEFDRSALIIENITCDGVTRQHGHLVFDADRLVFFKTSSSSFGETEPVPAAVFNYVDLSTVQVTLRAFRDSTVVITPKGPALSRLFRRRVIRGDKDLLLPIVEQSGDLRQRGVPLKVD
jgi:hypothetical protein